MTFDTIQYRQEDGVAVIRLYRPERMNAVNETMYQDLKDCLHTIEDDIKVRAVVLTGSILKRGDQVKPAFCAGADLKEHSRGRSMTEKRAYIELAHETTRMIYEFPKPIIAAVNGPARGAGAEMALNCDFILMADEASLAFPEIGLGTFIGGGATHHLTGLLGLMEAKELVYLGKVVTGPEAVDKGLALKSVPVEHLLDDALNLARDLCTKAPISLKYAKSLLQRSRILDLETTLSAETEAILSCMKTEDWHEGIRAFMEKRKPEYRGK